MKVQRIDLKTRHIKLIPLKEKLTNKCQLLLIVYYYLVKNENLYHTIAFIKISTSAPLSPYSFPLLCILFALLPPPLPTHHLSLFSLAVLSSFCHANHSSPLPPLLSFPLPSSPLLCYVLLFCALFSSLPLCPVALCHVQGCIKYFIFWDPKPM